MFWEPTQLSARRIYLAKGEEEGEKEGEEERGKERGREEKKNRKRKRIGREGNPSSRKDLLLIIF